MGKNNPNTSDSAAAFIDWQSDVDAKDYPAALAKLTNRFGQDRANELIQQLQRAPVTTENVTQLLADSGRPPLPISDPDVMKELRKAVTGGQISPILVALGTVADGFHRLSLVYALDPSALIPMKSV